jgi:protein-disulfide isomerase
MMAKKEVNEEESSDNAPTNKFIDDLINKGRKNPWMVISAVLVIALVVVLYMNKGGAGSVTGKEAGQNLVKFIDAQGGGTAEIVSIEKSGMLYRAIVLFRGQQIPVFVSLDGKYLIADPVPLEVAAQANNPSVTGNAVAGSEQEITKLDKPKVELFVMTHCPYGTQAEKGLIPVLEALGDKIDGKIRFVHYFMHEPEYTETPRQVCIREEQKDKYLDYLKCFLDAGDSDACLVDAKVDKAKMETCISKKFSDKYYAADSDLSNGYRVQGSPTLVINGQIVNSGRDSASYLKTICSAFNTAPKECSELQLSSSQPSPGFGYSASSASASAAQCG